MERRRECNWKDVASLNGAGEIMEEVLLAIARTDAVIVDVTTDNPNVFYELGIARLAKGDKKVIIVKQTTNPRSIQNTSNVPFDIRGDRYLEYESSPDGIQAMLPELEVRIKKALQATSWFRLAEGKTHIADALPGADGDYQFEVRAVSFVGRTLGREAVRLDVAVRPYAIPDASSAAGLSTRLFSSESCEIPNLPWRLKFERFERDDGEEKAVICVIPEGTR